MDDPPADQALVEYDRRRDAASSQIAHFLNHAQFVHRYRSNRASATISRAFYSWLEHQNLLLHLYDSSGRGVINRRAIEAEIRPGERLRFRTNEAAGWQDLLNYREDRPNTYHAHLDPNILNREREFNLGRFNPRNLIEQELVDTRRRRYHRDDRVTRPRFARPREDLNRSLVVSRRLFQDLNQIDHPGGRHLPWADIYPNTVQGVVEQARRRWHEEMVATRRTRRLTNIARTMAWRRGYTAWPLRGVTRYRMYPGRSFVRPRYGRFRGRAVGGYRSYPMYRSRRSYRY